MSLNLWKYRPRIRTVLIAVNGIILLLPLAGIRVMRLYENELVQRTETALISQGVTLREMMRHQYMEVAKKQGVEKTEGGMVDPTFRLTKKEQEAQYLPIDPYLDIYREMIRPAAGEAVFPETSGDIIAIQAGANLLASLRHVQRSTLVGIRIVDQNGIVVSTTRSELGQSLLHREEVARALRGENVSILRQRISDEPLPPVEAISRGARVRVFVALPIRWDNQVYGAVILSRTPLDIAKAMYYNRFVIGGYMVGLVIVVLFASLLTATTIARPIQKLIEQTRRVKSGKATASEPIDKPRSYEIGLLSEAIADMANTLSERAEYIQAFARNVSHEFKTPIAAIQGTVELLTDHAATLSDAERQKFHQMLTQDAKRMERLVSRLLVLARADMAKPTEDTTDAFQVIREVVSRYTADEVNIAWANDSTTDSLPLRIAEEIFATILTNLIDNSRQHGGDKVAITLTTSVAEGELILDVGDDGPGISEANRKKVFSAFFTTARESGGTGLGLSIVRSLVHAHHGRIRLEETTKGTKIRIWWPLSLVENMDDIDPTS